MASMHRKEIECYDCDKVFRSAQALEQHRNAVHCTPVECDYCDECFCTEEALIAHEQHKHPIEPDLFQGVPFSGAVGHWVYRQDFQGRKGFGTFQCSKCFRYWSSAHAHRKDKWMKQSCQRCEVFVKPYIMWIFTEAPAPHKNENETPHDANRCEACLNGDFCTTRRPDADMKSKAEIKKSAIYKAPVSTVPKNLVPPTTHAYTHLTPLTTNAQMASMTNQKVSEPPLPPLPRPTFIQPATRFTKLGTSTCTPVVTQGVKLVQYGSVSSSSSNPAAAIPPPPAPYVKPEDICFTVGAVLLLLILLYILYILYERYIIYTVILIIGVLIKVFLLLLV
jgi:hypothetical protein